MPLDPKPWSAYAAGLTLRAYQERAIERFQTLRAEGKRDAFYLVAPPGSGKTLLGLLMAEAIGRPAVVLSPNAAIQSQWLARLREHWHCVDPALDGFAPSPPAAAAPGEAGLALVSLTFQRLSVRDEDGGWHPNVRALHAQLAELGVGTLILDECHHLSATWGEAAESLAAALQTSFVIGLTATPVEQEEGPLARLLGAPDHEISLPSVIRSGDLTPFQDLCHLVPPSRDEEEALRGSLARFEALFEELRHGGEERFSLDVWLDMLELEPRSVRGDPYPDLLDMFAAEPELVTAWSRLRSARGLEVAALLPPLPELYEPPTLTDRLLVTAEYTSRHLLVEQPSAPLSKRAVEELAVWGLEVRAGRVRRRAGELNRRVGASRQKIEATAQILATEMAAMGDELRALVLTDYESPPAGSGHLSCVDVMQRLTATPEVDELDPILITGRSLLIDDDLWERFSVAAEQLCAEHGWSLEVKRAVEHGYWRLDGRGPDWETRVLVSLVTELLERGLTRCLIGTRALLGEGWDCLRLNTLIDLTVVTSGVAVNQIQGRTLRRDPDNDVKVANNWDVLCLSSLGDGADLERLRDKHARLYGVTDDGRVERGLGHLHARFARVSVAELFAARDEVNQQQLERAIDRLGARARWRVGEPYRDEDVRVLSFSVRSREAPATPALAIQTSAPRTSSALVRLPPERLRHAVRRRVTRLGVGAAITAGVATAAVIGWLPLLLLAPVPLAIAALTGRGRGAPVSPEQALEDELRSLASVLLATLARDARDAAQIEVSRRDDGTLRVGWGKCTPQLAERLTIALAELLGPITNPRYLVVEPQIEVLAGARGPHLFGPRQQHEQVFPVPRALARKRDAQRLIEHWCAQRNASATLVHADTAQGVELRQRWLRRQALDGEVAVREVWT